MISIKDSEDGDMKQLKLMNKIIYMASIDTK